jgi:hypothetical protein
MTTIILFVAFGWLALSVRRLRGNCVVVKAPDGQVYAAQGQIGEC